MSDDCDHKWVPYLLREKEPGPMDKVVQYPDSALRMPSYKTVTVACVDCGHTKPLRDDG